MQSSLYSELMGEEKESAIRYDGSAHRLSGRRYAKARSLVTMKFG
jgi:hypothetical protein